MKSENTERLDKIRYLNKETGEGLLFCYKVLTEFDYDEQMALDYMTSDAFERHILIRY